MRWERDRRRGQMERKRDVNWSVSSATNPSEPSFDDVKITNKSMWKSIFSHRLMMWAMPYDATAHLRCGSGQWEFTWMAALTHFQRGGGQTRIPSAFPTRRPRVPTIITQRPWTHSKWIFMYTQKYGLRTKLNKAIAMLNAYRLRRFSSMAERMKGDPQAFPPIKTRKETTLAAANMFGTQSKPVELEFGCETLGPV